MNAEEKYCREVCVIPVDFSKGQVVYSSVTEQLQDLDVGILGKPEIYITPS